MSIATLSRYITRDPDLLPGEPIIRGTKTPVRAIIELRRLGTPPEEVLIHLPYLTLAQVFDALSYYADYKEEIDSYIEQNHVPDHMIHPLIRSTLQ